MKENIDYNLLFRKMLAGECSPADTAVLTAWLAQATPDSSAMQLINAELQRSADSREINEEARTMLEDHLAEILNKGSEKAASKQIHRVNFLHRGWLRYAAVLAVVLGAGLYILLSGNGIKPRHHQVADLSTLPSTPILAGGNKAILTLSDGSSIILDSASDGTLTKQGNTRIVKLDDGQIAYLPNGAPGTKLLYNTMTTPRGGQYKLQLPDGTKVWLNAASSITYPIAFDVAERKVSVKGEAYFEIAKDAAKPFKVATGNMEVQVLGTEFNLNAYEDESVFKTTLLQGSVKVISKDHSQEAVLTPGQQAVMNNGTDKTGNIQVTPDVNLQQVTAWKGGLFNFRDADLPSVMRQLERWYDIKVGYEGAIPVFNFQGKLTRDLSLQEVLDILSKVGVKFRMTKGTLIVSGNTNT